MDGFSDIESSSSDVGAEVNEVETPDADFGDGDGVNDFDDTYESMNSGDETMEYSQETPENQEPVENINEDTDTAVDEQLNDFDDVDETVDITEVPDTAPAGDNVEQTPSDMTTDENVDDALSDFEDDDESSESDVETITDETGESDTEATTAETGESDTETTTGETGESDSEETADETDESDSEETADEIDESETENAADETDESDTEDTTDETGEADTETTTDETGEADSEETADETDEADTDDMTDETDTEETADETDESETENAADETDEADTEDTTDETGEADTETTTNETGEADSKETADETDEANTEDTTDETDEADTESTADETDEVDTDDMTNETDEADTEDTADETDAEDTVDETSTDGVNDAAADGQNGETEASSIDGSDDVNNDGTDSNSDTECDHTEKNAVFENVSYHQGQNDLGALGTCGPTSIANSLNRVTGSTEYTENKVLHNAMDNNLCYKSDNPYSCGGTTTRDVVNIIDNVKNPDDHIHTEVYEYDKALSVEDLANRLDDPGTVAMVGVDSATLWDQRGDVACSGLFQHTDSPSDHWITVDSPIRDEAGNLTGFNVIDSGGGVSEVSREKFEAMYMGDAGHTVSDPTAVVISNNGDAGSTYTAQEGLERASNYKGSAEVSDGNDPPEKSEIQVGVTNMECDINGDALSDEAKEINDKFRGDNFDASNSFESTFNDSERKEIIDKNASTTCGLNENLDGKLDGSKFSAIDKTSLLEAREKVPEIKPDTVMQKVIPSAQVDNYLNGDWTQVRNCCSKADDTAPYISCGSDAYKELRLDYKGNDGEGCNVKELEQNADVYIIRFTSDANPSDIGIPNDGHPCTGTGFIGSEDHLIPEYKYPATTPTDGAIYKIDADGNETMVGMWDKDANRFYPVP